MLTLPNFIRTNTPLPNFIFNRLKPKSTYDQHCQLLIFLISGVLELTPVLRILSKAIASLIEKYLIL